MKKFLKPRKINIVDIIILLLLVGSMVVTLTVIEDRCDYSSQRYSKLEKEIWTVFQKQDKSIRTLGVEQTNSDLAVINLLEKGHTANVERIAYLESTVSEISRLMLKINDWTVETDIVLKAMLNGDYYFFYTL